MSSANNTLETEDGNSTAEQESIPTTTSVLDKSRSLFGNSSSVLATPGRDPTPDVQSGETSAVTEPLVEMAAEPKEDSTVGATVEKTNDSVQEEEEEPMDTTESVVQPSDDPNPPEEDNVEEVFEKKVVSMDTSQDNAEDLVAAPDSMETDEDEEKAAEIEVDDEEEEEEAPVKKAKRAAPTSEDDEASRDDAEPMEQADEPVEAEQKAISEQQEETESKPVTEAQAVDSDETLSLVIDESAEKSVESVIAPEDDIVAEESPEEIPEEKPEEVPEEQPEEVPEDQPGEIPEDQPEPAEEEEPVEEDKEEPAPSSSTRRTRGRRSSASIPTPTAAETPRRGRGRASQVQKEAAKEVVEETPKKRGRASRGKKAEVPEEEVEEASEEPLEEAAEVAEAVVEEGSARRGRARRSAAQAEVPQASVDPTDETEEQEVQTPRRGGRARRSAAAVPTPRSTRGKGRKSNVEPEEEQAEDVGEQEEPETEGDQNEEVEEEEVATEESEAPSSSRRSTRAKATPKAAPSTPAPTTKRTPARGRKKQTSLTEEVIEETDETVEATPPVKKGRGAKSAPSSSKKKDEYDPYDLETEIGHHPEPLRNIQPKMEVKNFGAVTYAKVGGSESKYANTEKAAESRIGDLNVGTSSKNRRSLADMTPGKEKVKHRMSFQSGRKSRGKKDATDEVDDVEMEEEPGASSSATPASTNRSRKRKSDAIDAVTPAKKQAIPQLKEFDDEEQLKIDHPDDDNEPHAPGARVYANFNKTFYPAIILTERDGLGRYKLQFTADKLVKDVPNAGIIPLRAVESGKTAIFEESDVLINSGVQDVSAEEWFKGKVCITLLDDDGEPTEETKTVAWSDISFDQVEWKDYIKSKEQSATAVVTSNITTLSEATRARKPVAAKAPAPKPKSRRVKGGGELASSRGASSPRSPIGEDEDKMLPMHEKGVGKKIFAGKIFMLTSANRSNSSSVSPVFKKKNLMEFISKNGGVVTEQLNDFQEGIPNHERLLISDTYYRTHKYLAALARGIPCVSNLWLQECGEQGECVDYKDFILPAGCSIFTEQDMPAPENPSELLSGKTVYVHSTTIVREVTQTGPGGTFVEIWKPIIKLLGANVLEADWESLREENVKFDVVLVDGTFREEVMDYADEINASKVTSEWVIQTIILGEPPEATAHLKFDPYRLHHRTH